MTGDDFFKQLMARQKELGDEGYSFHAASEIASLEMAINQWPEKWGDELVAHLYGHLRIEVEVNIPELGITIKPEKKTPKNNQSHFVFGAPYSYSAIVKLSSRDIKGLLDAINRLEKFLSAWRMTEWPHRPINYSLRLSNLSVSTRAETLLDDNRLENIKKALSAINEYNSKQQKLILLAAWWIRQCERPLWYETTPYTFHEYLSYWNALECLTEAICDICKPDSLTKSQKNNKIQEYIAKASHPLTSEDIATLYNEVVDPGLTKTVKNALNYCFGMVGDQYHNECFLKSPKGARLYQVRNDIAHGKIAEYDFDNRLRVEEALDRLHLIVNNMLSCLSKQSLMLDWHVKSCYTCMQLTEDRICSRGLLPPSERIWRFFCEEYKHNDSMPEY